MILGGAEIGGFAAQNHATLNVDLHEIVDASVLSHRAGIVITVIGRDASDRASTGFLAAETAGAVIKGMDYVATVNKDATRLELASVTFTLQGQLTITAHPSDGERREISIGIGTVQAVLSSENIAQFRALLEKAQARLQALK